MVASTNRPGPFPTCVDTHQLKWLGVDDQSLYLLRGLLGPHVCESLSNICTVNTPSISVRCQARSRPNMVDQTVVGEGIVH